MAKAGTARPGRKPILSDRETEEVCGEYEEGGSLRRVARPRLIAHSTVRRALLRRGKTLRREGGTPILSDEELETAAPRYENGESLAQVAAPFGVSWMTMNRGLQRIGVTIRPRGRNPQA